MSNYDRHGSGNSRWKGGRRRRRDGYVLVYAPTHPFAAKNFVLEHRLVMEKSLGRYLLPSEFIHHINKVKWDNRLENLMLTNKHEHMHHHAGEVRPKRWKEKIGRGELAALYLVDGLTISECARRLGISYGATHRHFEQFGIHTRKTNPWWVRTHRTTALAGNSCRQSGAEAIRIPRVQDSCEETGYWGLQSCRL